MSGDNQFDSKKFAEDLRAKIHARTNAGIFSGNRPPKRSNGIIPGIVLIAVGSVFLLDHLGLIHAESLWKFWPLILVTVGLFKLLNPGERVMGIGFILVGALLQLHELRMIGLSWGTIWPFILIFVGVSLIWNRFEGPKVLILPDSVASGGHDTVNEYALFGGVERRVTVNNFRGGNVTAIFGGVELDFRSAEIEGEEATLVVEAAFGGIEIIIPERWNVSFQVQSIFAGYSDETRPPLPDPVGAPPRKTLVVHGRATFGGITVKN